MQLWFCYKPDGIVHETVAPKAGYLSKHDVNMTTQMYMHIYIHTYKYTNNNIHFVASRQKTNKKTPHKKATPRIYCGFLWQDIHSNTSQNICVFFTNCHIK